MSTVESGPRDGHHEVRATHFVGQSCKAEESCFGTSYRAGDHGVTTAMQRDRHASKGFIAADMLDDCPVCFFVCLFLLCICLVMGGFVLIGVF